MRLRELDQRRAQALREEISAREASTLKQALDRAQARRPYMLALIAALAAGLIAAVFLQQKALRAGAETARVLEQANAINRFINEDLVARSNPLIMAKGQNAEIKDLLLGARRASHRATSISHLPKPRCAAT
ncbi:hypothetical protein HC761_00485 [bacterium]|nr:hypothetical protein [bacterium]